MAVNAWLTNTMRRPPGSTRSASVISTASRWCAIALSSSCWNGISSAGADMGHRIVTGTRAFVGVGNCAACPISDASDGTIPAAGAPIGAVSRLQNVGPTNLEPPMTLRTAVVLACAPLCALRSPAARADELSFDDHLRRAAALAADEQYRESVRELEAAYALRQSPRVLYELGRAYARLGEAQPAIAAYERFLAAEPALEEPMRARVERAIAELRGRPAAVVPALRFDLPGDVRLAPIRMELQSNHGLVAGGVSLLATSYAAAMIGGSVFAAFGASEFGGSDDRGNLAVAGGMLIIPVVGPFVSSLV